MDFSQALHDYCVWHQVSNHSSRTIAWYQHKLGLFQSWLLGHDRPMDVGVITLADARAFILDEQQRDVLYPGSPSLHERSGKLSDRTIDSYVRTIKSFWRWLSEEEYVSRDVMAKLKRPKLEKRSKQVLREDEVGRLLSLCNQRTFLGARMYALIAILYDSGLRASEVVNLNVVDVDMHRYHLRVVKGKGNKERWVPFGPATYRALRKYLTMRAEYADSDCDALFLGKNRRRMNRGALTQVIKRLGVRAGIPRLHPHLLRHSSAVAYIMNGGDQSSLKRILGHEQLSTTDMYLDYAQQHLADQHKRFSPMGQVSEYVNSTSITGKRRPA